jgi:hypothetical protein
MEPMSTLKAQVKNGRLVLDEPTDLPEGTVVELEEADPFANMDPEERKKLHAALDASEKEFAEGKGIPAEQVLQELRARR